MPIRIEAHADVEVGLHVRDRDPIQRVPPFDAVHATEDDITRARAVLGELGLKHPTEIEIEAIAHARGALVRAAPTRGARANLLRMGDRGVISVDELVLEQRRWAIAHELGHFEVHPNISYLGFCTGEDLRADYHGSGREPEANAFAAELLMPEALFQKAVDKVAKPA